MVLYARDIVEKDFLSLSPKETVLEAARSMRTSRHGFAVVGSHQSPEGIVTEWDIVSKVVAGGLDPSKVTLTEIMTRDVVYVDAGTGIDAVSRMMNERGIRRMLVKQGDEVIGFITSKTLLARLNDYVDKVSSQIGRLQGPWV